jgi:hypothetical protein
MEVDNKIDYLEYCTECSEFFEKSEMKEIDGEYYCRDCSKRCNECNQLINEDNCFNESFCSRECCKMYFHDLYEEDWKDNHDEY